MKVGSLFSGIGGFDLGLERAGFEISWQVEIDEYCRKVLRKHWPAVPCHADIKTIDWANIPAVDLVCGGFPCQPFSCAGKRAGKEDDRYLWPEVVRCLEVVKPAWFLGENVPGILNMGIVQMLTDLEAIGYQTTLLGIPAAAVQAPHIRERIWFLSYAKKMQRQAIQRGQQDGTLPGDESDIHTNADNGGCSRRTRQQRTRRRGESTHRDRWPDPPALCRMDARIPRRVDRVGSLANAVVPQIVEALGRMILTQEDL